MKFLSLFIVAMVTFTMPVLAQEKNQNPNDIGQVTRLEHNAMIGRHGISKSLILLDKVKTNDVISTQNNARLEITFLDGTVLTLGENARLTLDRYVYDPKSHDNGFTASVTKGAFLFITGLIGKQPKKDVQVITPYATIGIRGTKFWGGPLDNPFDVLLLDGKIQVTTSQNTVLLDKKFLGTSIRTPNGKSQSPTTWPLEKQKRAFVTVTFSNLARAE